MKLRCLLLALGAAFLTSSAIGIDVKPTDTHIRYVGRFDFHDPAGPRCAWPASTVEIMFMGSNLKGTIREGGDDRFDIVLDGVLSQVLKLQKGDVTYDLVAGASSGLHKLRIVKRTEAFPGTTQFLGFDVSGKLMPPLKPKHILEVIGDSISCGYGIEGKVKEERFSVDTENANMTYGALAARRLNADFIDIAWSGRTMWPNNSIPDIYDLALPADKTTAWDLTQEIPDAIVINLATNDFGKTNPDERGWTEAYAAFIARLRKRAPTATVYCAMGPMMSDNWPPNNMALSTLRRYLGEVVGICAAAGDSKVKTIEFEIQNEQRDGIGSDWHPNLITHRNMADRLYETIRADLGWR